MEQDYCQPTATTLPLKSESNKWVMLIQEHALLVWIMLSVKSHLKWRLTLFLSILTPDSLSAKSHTILERYSKVAHHGNTDNFSSLSAQVHLSYPQQFVCPLSLDCSFLNSPFYFVTMTTVSKWVAHISHSLSSFIFHFPCSDFHLSVFSTHSPTLLAHHCDSQFSTLQAHPRFFSFSPP